MKLFNLEKSNLFIALLIILIFFTGIIIVNYFPWTSFGDKGKGLHKRGTSLKEKEEEVMDKGTKAQNELKIYLSYLMKSSKKRDPFLSLRERDWKDFLSELSERPLRLEGIIDMEGSKIALFEGKGFVVGQAIGGFQISHIGEDTVKLTKGGKTYILHLTEKGGLP